MSKNNRLANRTKTLPAQGMVEFALALPVFLLLVFGVIEFGRLLMTFSAVFSAAREAARYGAAVGTNDAGIKYDHDCNGMRDAAIRVGRLGGVSANQIQITLLNSDGSIKDANWCSEDNSYKETVLGDIIQVKVDGSFWPILPLVNLSKLPVSSTSSRTIVQNVEVFGTPQPTSVVYADPNALTLTIDINPPETGTVLKNPDKPTYHLNDAVSLVPVPINGWEFSSWSHDLSGNSVPASITMTGNRVVTANFVQSHYTLTTNVEPAGAGSISADPGGGTYLSFTPVNLTAVALPGYEFIGWMGDAGGSSTTTSITMDSNKSVTAVFNRLEYNLTITTQGQGTVAANVGGPYHYGDLVELTATSEAGWNFSTWGGDQSGSENPVTIVIDGNKNITATFEEGTYTLTTVVTGGGKIVKNPDQGSYLPGTVVTLTAVPNPGWVFSFWASDVSYDPGQNPIQILMDGNKVVGVSFAPASFTLTINVVGKGSVMTSQDPPYAYQDVVQLTANPAPGWVFSGWSDGIIGADNPASITMDSNKSVTATFTPIEYTLSLSVTGQGSIALSPLQAKYHFGDVVQLTAIPGLDYSFTRWGGDLSGSTNPATITMDSNKAVSATFDRTCVSPSLITVIMTGGVGSEDVNFQVMNNSDLDIDLLSMVVTWSTAGGRLEDIYLGGQASPIWSGSVQKQSSPFLVTDWAVGISRRIPRLSARSIQVHFSASVNSASIMPMTFTNVCSTP